MMRRMNLLPKPKQQQLTFEKLFYSVAVACTIGVVFIGLSIMLQFGVYWYLKQESSHVDTEIESMKRSANKTENAAVKAKIRLANSQITDFSDLTDKTPQWSQVLAAFVRNVPDTVRITNFNGDAETGEIKITGFSLTRDQVIDLYNNINADKEHFKDINYPLENVAQPTNVRFNFTFSIADGILIPTKK